MNFNCRINIIGKNIGLSVRQYSNTITYLLREYYQVVNTLMLEFSHALVFNPACESNVVGKI
jgi:hypothetical protein